MELTFLKKCERASRAECSRHKKIRLITLILACSGALFALSEYRVTNYHYEGGVTRSAEFQGYFGVVLLCMAAAMGFVTVFSVFSDMTSKQDADVQLSLPMSSLERFVSKLIAIAKLNILPVAGCAYGMTLLGSLITGCWKDINFPAYIFWIMMDVDMFGIAIAIFCTVCCGAKAEARYTSVIGGLCVSFLPFAAYSVMISNYSGVRFGMDDNVLDVFSSFGVMVFTVLEKNSTAEATPVLVANLLTSCLLIFASYFIYRSRDAKSVGKPMVFTVFMEIFFVLGVFSMYTLFLESNAIAFCVVISLVIYLTIRIIAARAKLGVKLFFIWVGKYFLTVGVFYAIAISAYTTGVYGAYKAMPDISDSKYDTLEINVTIDERSDGMGREYKLEMVNMGEDASRDAVSYVIGLHDLSNRDVDAFWNTQCGTYDYNWNSSSPIDGKHHVDIYITGGRLKKIKGAEPQLTSDRVYSKSFYTNADVDEIVRDLESKGMEVTYKYDGDHSYDYDVEYDSFY